LGASTILIHVVIGNKHHSGTEVYLAALDMPSSGMFGLLVYSFPCFDKMAGHDRTKRYGVRLVEVKKKCFIGIVDEPLVEEDIRETLNTKRNAQVQENHNDLCQRLIHALDDKIFVTKCLAFVTSLITGENSDVPPRKLEYEEVNGALSLSEKERIMNRLTDANLTLSADIKTLSASFRVD
jgi:hypothetical protein